MTDIGQQRPRNEDQFLIASLSKTLNVECTSLDVGETAKLFGNSQGRLLLVADGMGGHAAGDHASAVVVSAFADYVLNMLRWYFRADPSREPELTADLFNAVKACQNTIKEQVSLHPDEQGMGATLTLAYVIWPRMFVVHVGDSRCYILRNGRLTQLTHDHTMVQKLLDEHILTPKQAESSQFRNVLWNAVGGETDEVEPDIFREDLEFGDTILLCTDGLTKHVPDAEIEGVLLRHQNQSTVDVCRELVAAANAGGGTDNITVVVARFPISPPMEDPLTTTAISEPSQADTAVFAERPMTAVV